LIFSKKFNISKQILFFTYLIDFECHSRKGVGRVRFSIPLNVQSGSPRNISVDIYTTHTYSDKDYTGQSSDKRVKQMNQIMPRIDYSDADVVILGGDFNDHPLSGKKIRESRKLKLVIKDKRSEMGYGGSRIKYL
jgi:hypothetical protein